MEGKFHIFQDVTNSGASLLIRTKETKWFEVKASRVEENKIGFRTHTQRSLGRCQQDTLNIKAGIHSFILAAAAFVLLVLQPLSRSLPVHLLQTTVIPGLYFMAH